MHALNAERDIVLPILSVCLSLRLSSAGTKRMDISSHFFDIVIGTSF